MESKFILVYLYLYKYVIHPVFFLYATWFLIVESLLDTILLISVIQLILIKQDCCGTFMVFKFHIVS